MLDKIFSPRVANALNNVNEKSIVEIRFRSGKPIQIFTNQFYYLKQDGLTTDASQAIKCSTQELNDIVFNACNRSIYAHNDEIKQGFLTLDNGMRLGIAGEVVMEGDEVKTIKNFSGLNLRFAREVKNCSLNALKYLCEDGQFVSTLVISPPNCGKTTFIRDLCYQLSSRNLEKNILVIDERNEICACINGIPTFDVGNSVDIYSGSTKDFGVINGIRTMAPSVIVLDEISTQSDIKALKIALASGVRLIATTHSADYCSLKNKYIFKDLDVSTLFNRFVVLSNSNGIGTIDAIFNNVCVCVYCGG